MKATFELKWFTESKANRKRPTQTLAVDSLLIGSRGGADIFVQDRWVALEAIRLRPALGGLSIQPINLFAGGFLDGVPIQGHEILRPGSALQIGQVLIELTEAKGEGQFSLKIDENYLHAAVQKATDKGAALIEEQAQEARWGKHPRFVLANRAAAAVGLLVVMALPFLRDTNLVTRGPLSWAHAHAGEGGTSLACDDCHDSESATTLDGACVHCHPGYDRDAARLDHPYDYEERLGRDALQCIDCHREHQGPDMDTWPPVVIHGEVLALLERGQPPEITPPLACAYCHGEEPLPIPEETSSWPASMRRDRRTETTLRPVHINSFSHSDHLDTPNRIQCSDCHTLAADRQLYTDRHGEFRPVPYATCVSCHKDKIVEEHSRNSSDCKKCHDDPDAGSLREVTVVRSEGLYSLPPRSHDTFLDARADCQSCHVRGTSSGERVLTRRPFRHDSHLKRDPAGNLLWVEDGKGGVINQQCIECHPGVESSRSLASLMGAERQQPDPKVCARCHGGEVRREQAPGGTPAVVVDMFHASHTSAVARKNPTLAAGCIACHSLDGPQMGLLPGIADCKACHDKEHRNITCTKCHFEQPGHFEGRAIDRGVLSSQFTRTVERESFSLFRHTSVGHQGIDCLQCHKEPAAATVEAVEFPRYSDVTVDSCVACHIASRYHR